MSTHTMTATFPVKFTWPGFDDYETADVELEITFMYSKGRAATGPSYSSGGEPAEPPEVELVSAEFIKGDGISPGAGGQTQVNMWADDYLNDEAGYEHACRVAEADLEPNEIYPDFDEDHHDFIHGED